MQGILYSQPECLAVKDLYKILHSHKLSAHCLKKGADHHIQDVYKRQVLHRARIGLKQAACSVVWGHPAVSYTHLDVYKRQVISCTHQGFTEYAQEIAAFCASDNDYGTAASRFGIIIEPCILEETLICYFMILDKKSGYMIPYLKTLTELLISPQISDIQNQTASSRSMLINQIANTGQKSPEIDTFMKEFEYSYDCPRCALLFEINRHGKEHSHYRFDSSESYLKQLDVYKRQSFVIPAL